MTEPTVFVELCAGLGALSLSAVAGWRTRGQQALFG
jgi:hypothetical protein